MTSNPSRRASLALVGAVAIGCRQDVDFVPQEPSVLEADHGQWLSMDVSPDGQLAVTYYDRSMDAIGFAAGEPREDGAVFWNYEEVDGYPDDQGLNTGDRGKFTSMKIADDGRVWASYYDATNKSLRAAFRDRGVWTSEVADTGSGLSPDAGLWTSLDLDADGNPVVAHYDAKKGALRVARRDSAGSWTAAEVFVGEPVGETPAGGGQMGQLVIADGVEHIVFYDAGNGSLNLLEGTPGSYTHTLVADDGDSGQWPSIAFDGTTTWIAYHRADTQDLMLATRSGSGAFTTQILDDGEYRGADTEVFVPSAGHPAVLYFDGHENDLWLATSDGATWSRQKVAGDDIAVGYHNEVAYTRGHWWAGCYDYTNRRIFVTPLAL